MSGQTLGIEKCLDISSVGPESRAVLQEAYEASKNYEPHNVGDGIFTTYVDGKVLFDMAMSRAIGFANTMVDTRKLNEKLSFDPENSSLACRAWLVAESLRNPDMYCIWVYKDTEILGEELTKKIGIAVAKDLGMTVAEADKAALIYEALSARNRKQWREVHPVKGTLIQKDKDYTAERVEKVVSALPEEERDSIRQFVVGVLKEAGVFGKKGEIRW